MMAAGFALAVDFSGVAMGQPLSMPECEAGRFPGSYAFQFDLAVKPCWKHSYGDRGKPLPSETMFSIGFIAEKYPPGVRSSELLIVNGKVEGVTVFTTGLDSQDEILEALTAKFGKPTALERTKSQNRMGAEFMGIVATWKLPNVAATFVGIGSRIDGGIVVVRTPIGEASDDASRAEAKAKAAGF